MSVHDNNFDEVTTSRKNFMFSFQRTVCENTTFSIFSSSDTYIDGVDLGY
jgi:hypothetical protein